MISGQQETRKHFNLRSHLTHRVKDDSSVKFKIQNFIQRFDHKSHGIDIAAHGRLCCAISKFRSDVGKVASDVFCFRHWYFSFFCQHALTEIDNYWTWLSLPLFRNIIVDESAAMNMLQGSFYFSENSIRHMFLAPTYFEVPRKKNYTSPV